MQSPVGEKKIIKNWLSIDYITLEKKEKKTVLWLQNQKGGTPLVNTRNAWQRKKEERRGEPRNQALINFGWAKMDGRDWAAASGRLDERRRWGWAVSNTVGVPPHGETTSYSSFGKRKTSDRIESDGGGRMVIVPGQQPPSSPLPGSPPRPIRLPTIMHGDGPDFRITIVKNKNIKSKIDLNICI